MAIRLYVQASGQSGTLLDFESAVVVIGRSPENEVVLDDKRSSRKHCRILETPQGIILEDLKSANGTVLNGEPVTKSFLSPGDVIRIGQTSLRYQADGDQADGDGSAPEELELEFEPESERDLTPPTGVRDRPPAGKLSSQALRGRLTCIKGELQGQSFDLSGAITTIGRSKHADVTLKDARVSSKHVEIIREGNDTIVKDLGSKNGILVAGKKVRRAVLLTGTQLVVGNFAFEADIPGTVPVSRKAGVRQDRQSPVEEGSFGTEEMALGRIDVDHFFAGDRVQQPLIAAALVIVVALVCYFVIDIGQRLLIEKEADPSPEGNLIQLNWSFEEILAEGATGTPGWALAEGCKGSAEITREEAQYPGSQALYVTSDEDALCAVVQSEGAEIVLGLDREYILEGYVAGRGAFFAALLIEWLRRDDSGSQVMGRTFSESTQGSQDTFDVYMPVVAPDDSTHARIACVVYGAGGAAFFDRVAFSEKVASGDSSSDVSVPTSSTLSYEAGNAESGILFSMNTGGDFLLETRSRRLELPSIWAGLDSDQDPLAIGARLVPPIVHSGDRGTFLVSTRVPNTIEGRWSDIEATVRGSASDIIIDWRLVSEIDEDMPGKLALHVEMPRGDLPVLAHGEISVQMRVDNVKGDGFREIVFGSRKERISFLFGSPVSISSRPHPVLTNFYLLTILPTGNAREMQVSFVPGSRSEKQAAIAMLREASRLKQEGKLAAARKMLEELEGLYSEQERQVSKGVELLAAWSEEAGQVVGDLRAEYQKLRESPSPVVYESLLARAGSWGQRYQGTREGEQIESFVAEMNLFWTELESQVAETSMDLIYKRAQEAYQDGHHALCEVLLTSLIKSAGGAKYEEEATKTIQKIRGRRETASELILQRK